MGSQYNAFSDYVPCVAALLLHLAIAPANQIALHMLFYPCNNCCSSCSGEELCAWLRATTWKLKDHGFFCLQTPVCSPDWGLVTLQCYRGGSVVGRSLVVLQCLWRGGGEQGGFPVQVWCYCTLLGMTFQSQDGGLQVCLALWGWRQASWKLERGSQLCGAEMEVWAVGRVGKSPMGGLNWLPCHGTRRKCYGFPHARCCCRCFLANTECILGNGDRIFKSWLTKSMESRIIPFLPLNLRSASTEH